MERACANLLANPKLREPCEELKFLNIDYTQFDEWSSDEEITVFTGIEKGYEKWLEVEEEEEEEISEHGLTSDDDEVVFNSKHTIDRLDYDDHEHFLNSEDYNAELDTDVEMLDTSGEKEIKDEITDEVEVKDAKTNSRNKIVDEILEPEPEKHCANKSQTSQQIAVLHSLTGGPGLTVEQLRGRLALARAVPGLEGSAVPPASTTKQVSKANHQLVD